MKKNFLIVSVIIEIICIGLGGKVFYSWGIFRDKYNIGIIENKIINTMFCCNNIMLILLVILLCITVIQLILTLKKII